MKIYLAGFDVFRPDAHAQGERLKAACAAHGFVGLYPLDGEVPAGLTRRAAAAWICEANLARMREADGVMANLNAFRGCEPDSGTAFEVGFAVALGKPVWAYTDDARDLVSRIARPRASADDTPQDAQGYHVEDFGLNLNLMLACTTHVVVGDAQACLAAMAQQRPAG